MAQTEDKFRKQLEVVKLKLDEIVEILASGNTEDISGTYEQIGELIKSLEKSKDTSLRASSPLWARKASIARTRALARLTTLA